MDAFFDLRPVQQLFHSEGLYPAGPALRNHLNFRTGKIDIHPIAGSDSRERTTVEGFGNNVRDRNTRMEKRDTTVRNNNADGGQIRCGGW